MKVSSKISAVFVAIFLIVMGTACSNSSSSEDKPFNGSLEATSLTILDDTFDISEDYYYQSNFEDQEDWILISGISQDGNQFEPEKIEDGLKVEINSTFAWFHSYQEFMLEDSYIEVELSYIDGYEPSVELYCRSYETGEYRFFVNYSGFWDISLFDFYKAEYKSLSTGDSNLINPKGEKNYFSAICAGDNLALMINGEIVGQINDDTYTYGMVGYGVQNWVQEYTEVIINNFLVREISVAE